jgi:hypothetical protein
MSNSSNSGIYCSEDISILVQNNQTWYLLDILGKAVNSSNSHDFEQKYKNQYELRDSEPHYRASDYINKTKN